ncbi:MAG TPA: hypothetical protein VKX28_31655 [Xanthobacteraceae bacterium]|nr:hypothetical protein [Xanthobacteraceae bacterium]
MSIRTSTLALAAIAALAISAVMPRSALAFGHTNRATTSAHVVITTTRAAYAYGRGYGRGWCYWHPYACYRAQ